MAKTLADLETRLLLKVGLPSDDAILPAATRVQCINNGLAKMAMDFDWWWLLTTQAVNTVNGTSLYLLPDGTGADPAWVRTLWITRNDIGLDLTYFQRRDLSRFGVTGVVGAPSRYAIQGNSFRLAPTPGQVYSLTHCYVRAEEILVDPTDEPLCPESYIDIVVCYAASEACIFTKDGTLKGMIDAEILAWIRRSKDNVHQSSSTSRIRTRRDW